MRASFLGQQVFVLTLICSQLTKWSPLMTDLKLLKYTGLSTTTAQSALLAFSSTPLSLFLTPTQIHKQSLLHNLFSFQLQEMSA